MRYFVPFYGLWCMGKDAGNLWSNTPSDLTTGLALVWQSALLVTIGFFLVRLLI